MAQEKRQQVVPWFELFYDLIVVSVVVAAGKILIGAPHWSTASFTATSLLLLLVLWLLTTLSYGLYRRNSPGRRLLLLAQMGALLIAALAAGEKGLPSAWGYAALGVAFACAAGVYALHVRWDPTHSIPNRLVAAMCLVAAGYFVSVGNLLLGLFPSQSVTWSSAVLLVGLFVVLVPVAGPYLRCAIPRLDLHHLEERVGLVVIIVLGESFLALILRLSGQPTIPSIPAFLLALAVPYCTWSLYFTGVINRDPPQRASLLRLWFAAHVLLVISIATSATAIADMTLIPFGTLDDTESPWSPLSTLGIAVGLLAVCGLAGIGDAASRVTFRALTVAVVTIGALLLINFLPSGPPRGPLFLASSLTLVLCAIAVAILAPQPRDPVPSG